MKNPNQDKSDNWPEYRGPRYDSHSEAVGLPLEWSETKNVRWKTAIPGLAWSSPVVWGKQVWLTTADEKGHEQSALCLDRETGKILFQQTLFRNENPQRITVDANTYASPSPVIEAGRVYVHFGTFGTACLDTKTFRILWTRRDLHCDHSVGPGSSPFLYKDRLILTYDGMDVQFLIALDTKTGKTLWQTPRGTDYGNAGGEQRKSFTTPYPLVRGERTELVSVSARAVCGYDPNTGKELWRVAHPGYSNASRPLVAGGMLLINTGFNTPELWALRLDRPSGLAGEDRVWRCVRSVPAMSSPTVVDDLLYFLSDSEFVTCLELASGKEVWRERIGGKHYASPLWADGRLYLFGENGKTRILKPGRTFTLLGENTLAAGCHASPAVSGRALLLRSLSHLYCLETRR